MTTQPDFTKFTALPESVRNDIWERAADTILAKQSVHFINLCRHDVDQLHELSVVRGARAAATALGKEPARVSEAVHEAVRKYRVTLVGVTPHVESRQLATFSSSWTFSNVARVCTSAYQSTRRRLKVYAKQRRGGNVSSLFDPARDILCLEGPEINGNSTSLFPFFANEIDDGWLPFGQLLLVGTRGNRLGGMGVEEYGNSSPLCKICPALASLRRVAFIYPGASGDVIEATTYRHRLGLGALWPYNLPELSEICLIDTSIKLRAKAASSRQRLASAPSFAGSLGTFYEVSQSSLDNSLWNIWTAPNELLPVFKCASAIQRGYNIRSERLGTSHRVQVKVLAYIPHSQE